MQEVDVKKLKRGDLLKLVSEGANSRASRILGNFKVVKPRINDDLVFERISNGLLFVSFKGVISYQGWLPKRFTLSLPLETKEKQLLQKIDSLWKRQLYYKEHHAV